MSRMIDMAHDGRLVVSKDLRMIPELCNSAQVGTDYFFKFAHQARSTAEETNDPEHYLFVLMRICMYMFAKGVEAAMLWRDTSDGRISIEFDLTEVISLMIKTDLEPARREIVNIMPNLAMPLFWAHHEYVCEMYEQGRKDKQWIDDQVEEAIFWSMLIGIAYACEHNYHIDVKEAN